MIDRSTQDDKKSKISVAGLFAYPTNAEDFIKTLPAEHKWYMLDTDRLERFEKFYNYVQDINISIHTPARGVTFIRSGLYTSRLCEAMQSLFVIAPAVLFLYAFTWAVVP